MKRRSSNYTHGNNTNATSNAMSSSMSGVATTTTNTSNDTSNHNGSSRIGSLSASNRLLVKFSLGLVVLYLVMSWRILFQEHHDDSIIVYREMEMQMQMQMQMDTEEMKEEKAEDRLGVKNATKDSEELKDDKNRMQQLESYPLKAFIEPIYQQDWSIQPLPVRNTTSFVLKERTYDRIACSNLPSQWPTGEEEAPTNEDPFLPWIHDVFPTADGKFLQFIAQNKRRCQSGMTKTMIKEFMQPNIALFQHVPVTRITSHHDDSHENIRYRISSHEEADPDGVETRFICRFKPTMEETLSVFNLNYDYHTLRKGYKATFTKEGFDNHMIWTSQLLFQCPVPESLQEQVRLGTSVVGDYATLFVDLVPIRTPPRYGSPTRYLPPRLFSDRNDWDPKVEWGDHHVLPKIEDSGRWENIPICKPSLMTYPDQGSTFLNMQDPAAVAAHDEKMAALAQNHTKKRLVACTWTSTLFETRGAKTRVNDGEQRLLQWLEFNQLVGVDHVYVYDNSGAFSDSLSLKSVTDLFPGFATRIDWPAKVCNNRPGNADNKGERSSQYAAAMSCHLRFGVHSDWIMAADTDEYMVPLGKYESLKELLLTAEQEDIKVLNWKSKRSKPRLQYFNITPSSPDCMKNKCFDPSLPQGKTFLEIYNCNNEKPPRTNVMPAEKAIYRPDFVTLFFVHYATVTVNSQMGKPQAEKLGVKWFRRYRVSNLRYVDEETEGTMLHTKAIVEKETRFWNRTLVLSSKNCKIGVEWPEGKDERLNPSYSVDVHGTRYVPNCYPVPKIEKTWVPRLMMALLMRGKSPVTPTQSKT